MNKPSAALLYSFGRSGSTLLNQCLGCHPDNAVFSEVNPAASCIEPAWQAEHWLQLLASDEAHEFAALGYPEQVRWLARRCAEKRRHLVIRDWTTVNFLAGVVDGVAPSGVLEQELYLARTDLDLRRVVLARRATGVHHSLRSRFPQYHDLTLEAFAQSYLAYARAVCGFTVIHLEAFTAEPAFWLAKICDHLGVAYAPDFPERFFGYRNCTGNITLAAKIFSSTSQSIDPVRAPAGPAPHPLLQEADRLLGYEIT